MWMPLTALVCLLVTEHGPGHAFLIGHLDDPEYPDLGRGEEGVYRYGAVATNTDQCSQVGVEMMAKHDGSAVDAAIASALCVGVTRLQSSGIGGGNFITVYEKATGKSVSFLSRCMAPAASNSTMFVNSTTNASQDGGLAIAIPGELLGFSEAHKRYGRLPWRTLFQPSIKLAQSGFVVIPQVAHAIQVKVKSGVIERFPRLKAILTNPITRTWYKQGEIMRLPALARTLGLIADAGVSEFYNGSLADTIVREIQDAGGIITKQDLAQYYTIEDTPLKMSLGRGVTIHTSPLPSGGPILLYILNILSGCNMTPSDLSSNNRTVLTYHRIVEAFKHAYSSRSQLGSPEGEDAAFGDLMKQLVANFTDPLQGDAIRQLISDNQTFPWQSYNPSFYQEDDAGTSQISVLAPNGDAVSMTSTVNLYFGSKVIGDTTGILYNNNMDDFSTPDLDNAFGVPPSEANFIKPGKRPLSSMCPSITTDDATGRPVLVHGSAGGTRITTVNAFVAAMTQWLGEDIKSALDAPRPHHQLLPDVLLMSENTPQWLIDGLTQKGHIVKFGTPSTPNGILQRVPNYVLANAQGSIVDGY